MRLVHTSDWHLGRSLLNVSMLDYQRAFVTWLVAVVKDEQADLVVVAGDVFDRAVPPIEAVRVFEEALLTLSEACPVVVIPGNHDSPTRLGFASALLERSGVHLRASVDDCDRPVSIVDDQGMTTHVYGLPFLHPDLHHQALGVERTHEAVLGAAMDRIRADHSVRSEALGSSARLVVVSHAFVTGATASDSERDVSVGGIGDAPSSVFEGADYVALGHLHRPQHVHMPSGVARYSGSPLPYSFSEEGQVKSVVLVDLGLEGDADITQIAAPVARPLASIRGDLVDLLSKEEFADFEDAWVRAVITDPRRPPGAMDKVRSRFPHAIDLVFEPEIEGMPLPKATNIVDSRTATPIDVACGFVEHVTHTPADEAERRVLQESIDRVQVALVPR